MNWIVLKHGPKSTDGYTTSYIVSASSAAQAIERLCTGKGRSEDPLMERLFAGIGRERSHYQPTGRGRYFAIPLDVWQAGAFDYTKTRGVEKVNTGS